MKSYSEMTKSVIERRDQYDLKKRKRKKRVMLFLPATLFLCMVLVAVWGYQGRDTVIVKAANLLEGVKPSPVTPLDHLVKESFPLTDFAIKLFQEEGKKGGNVLISPLSALYSLGMMMNGADGSTKEQMEETLGVKTEELNLVLYSLRTALSQDNQKPLIQANSIWFSENGKFQVNQDFLQTCADYYEADILQLPFDDNMVREANAWVGERTGQVIPEIMEEAPEDAVAYIINAMSFEAAWENDKPRRKVHYGDFQMENGEIRTVTYFTFTEDFFIHGYMETGFVKNYQTDDGRKYAFVILLPRQGLSMQEYISKLDGQHFRYVIKNETSHGNLKEKYIVSIPRFTVTYESELSESLSALGMSQAFDENTANFGLLGTMESKKKARKSVPCIGKFIQKTMLSVDEKGTKARAASMVGFELEEDIVPEHKKEMFSRPFVYAIIDCETMFPLFLGICNEPVTE